MGIFSKNNSKKATTEKDTKTKLKKLRQALKIYQDAKQDIDDSVIVNNNWFFGDGWQYIKSKQSDSDSCTTPFILNACWNKHADAMDNYPMPIILEREQGDKDEAERLSKVLPLVLEQNNFKDTYSNCWWQKLKQGTAIYYVGWDNDKNNGLGDISIKRVDILRFFCEPHIDDLQDSQYIFIQSVVNTERLKKHYKVDISSDANSNTMTSYYGDYTSEQLGDKSILIDCYEKVHTETGETILHLHKFVGETLLYSSENDELLKYKGIYEHGLYPFVTDVFLSKENSTFGMGLVEICKPTQAYIDKLDYLIERNTYLSGKQRYLVKKGAGINKNDLLNMATDVVETSASLDEANFRILQANSIPSFIIGHRQEKITELKEVIGNRDFAQGGVSGGVTAFGAIAALQEAGNKLSRDIIKNSESCFEKIIYQCIELIRQFYDEPRFFRILGEDGNTDYVEFNNENLKAKKTGIDFLGNETLKQAIFDVQVVPQKKNPFSTNAHNQLIIDLYRSGAFTPQNAQAAITAVNAMMIDNKSAVIRSLKELEQSMQSLPTGQDQQMQDKKLQALLSEIQSNQ